MADTDTEPSWIFNPGSAAAAAIAFSFLLLPLSALVWAVSRNAWRLLLASVLLLGGFVGTNGPDLLVNESLGRHEETVVVQGQNGDCGRYQSHGESGGVTGCFFVVDGVEGTPSEVPIRCDEDECPKKGARITIWWAPEAVGTVHLTPPPSFAWVWWLPLGIGLALNAAALVLFARSGNRAWKPRK
ncbi:hypothetical protein [Glycomyces sp. NPDC048151]|uniref:hypothetical protein n=1 Tax=Glycomyces sp. NPDC048151 TaxID=3364002 RepID=UPI0037142C9E